MFTPCIVLHTNLSERRELGFYAVRGEFDVSNEVRHKTEIGVVRPHMAGIVCGMLGFPPAGGFHCAASFGLRLDSASWSG